MTIFGLNIQRASTYKAEITSLQRKVCDLSTTNDYVVNSITTVTEQLNNMKRTYPLTIGQTVYDIQLRNDKGRYTKTKPSRTYSHINEVVVDKKNYFGLVDRMHNNDVFIEKSDAEEYLNSVCID